ncbi:hypothetical protein [Leisingera sp.]|uniref:hypothetical protein n=1 Tax=Leisingera sp. TaxID=1879318 RepID=UPI002B273DD1|nr:hypothetical protein [Leisingera sp.]
MTVAMAGNGRSLARKANLIAYDELTGEILQTALLRPQRFASFTVTGKALHLLEEVPVSADEERIDPATLAILPRPPSPLEGQLFTAPAEIDLSWCPAGAQLTLHNEDGDTAQWVLPLADELVLTDPGSYTVILRGTFPYQEFIGELEVKDA